MKNTYLVLNRINIKTFQEQFHRHTRLSHNAKNYYLGLAYPDSNLILIDQNISDEDLRQTIIHECNHVLNYKMFKHSSYQLEYLAHSAEYMYINKTNKVDQEYITSQIRVNYNFKKEQIIIPDLNTAIF